MRIYDRDGNELPDISQADWSVDARRVGRTSVGEVWVSTVFLVIDHNWSGEGPPIIFETMVFGGPLDDACVRYSTEAEALVGHAEMVMKVKEADTLLETEIQLVLLEGADHDNDD